MSPVRRQISPHAGRLRRNMTDVEQAMWQALRNRQLGGFKFRRQATVGRYVVDFLCAERKLIVEFDGGQHDELVDASRTQFLEASGY
jgi:very-short-patch-repair endonuclease